MDVAHKQTDKLIADLEKRIADEYKRAGLDIQAKLNKYLEQYTAQDEKQRNLLKAGKITRDEYQQWVKRHVAIGQRWQAVRDGIAEDYYNVNKIARSMVTGFQYEAYALNHNFATYQVEHDALVDTNYTLYDRQTVERIIRDEPDLFHAPGKKVAAEIARNKDLAWNKQHVNSAILQGILQGESIPDLAKRLRSVTGGNYHAAVRNARTAMTGAQNAGRVNGYKRAEGMGINLEQEWVATLDGRTRHEHRQLHGQRVKIGTPFKIDGYELDYPGDPKGEAFLVYNCRCTVIAQIRGHEIDRVEYSPKMGNMTFEQWLKEKEKQRHAPKQIDIEVNITGALGASLGNRLDEYKGVIKKAGESVAKLYNNFSDKLKTCRQKSGSGCYWSSTKTIEWDESKWGDKWSTISHEYGHFIDDVIPQTSYSSNEVDLLNDRCKGKFGVFQPFKKNASSSDEFLSAMRADRENNKGFLTDDAINERMGKDLRKSSASAGVQDAFDGFWGTQSSSGKTWLQWGHGEKYYNRKYQKQIVGFKLEKDLKEAYKELGFDASNQTKVKTITRDYETASELWANVTAAKTVGGEELDYMSRYFPNAVAAWDKIVGGL